MNRREHPAAPADRSSGWEVVAAEVTEPCRRSTVGVATIEAWAEKLPPGGSVLDLGCGPGGPRSEVLVRPGFAAHAIDGSPSLASAYHDRFPGARVACEAAEASSFFGKTFDGILAWGLLFLLPADTQRFLLQRLARALEPGGSLLFTAPAQECTWNDLSTGRPSWSLGAPAYAEILAGAGLELVAEHQDEGENHYYEALKAAGDIGFKIGAQSRKGLVELTREKHAGRGPSAPSPRRRASDPA